MCELLESIMLICFGMSWPVNVYRNFRARTARGMSPMFILLIITGYIAGIAAKILSGNTGLILAVYLINLIMVLLNLAVYFRNRRMDAEQKTA